MLFPRVILPLAQTIFLAFLSAGPGLAARQFLITPASVVSSSQNDLFAAANLIDNSGLNPVPTLGNYQRVRHGSANPSRAWATNSPGGTGSDYFGSGGPNPVLTFGLPALYQVTDLVVWGFYYTSSNNNEAQEFTVEFSVDNGLTWNSPTRVRHAQTSALSEKISLGGRFQANAVRLTITDNHYIFRGIGGDRVGLGEVKFIAEPPPPPHPSLFLKPLIDFGSIGPGESIQARALDLRNVGSELLVVDPGKPAPPFHVTGGSLEIPPGEQRTLLIDLAPVAGCHLSTLELATNDPLQPVVPVHLLAAYDCEAETAPQPGVAPEEGTFIRPFEATISSAEPGVIVYTTDGSVPDSANGIPYTDPIPIESSTLLRAAVLRPASISKPQTRSYLRLSGGLENYTSPIPIAIIDNFGGGKIPNKGWAPANQNGGSLQQVARQPACIHLIDIDSESGRASMTGTHDLTERIGIRVRGAFSSTWNPKPYSVETWDEYGNDKTTSPLGLPGESDWILYYPHPNYDRQLIANTFSWELSRQTGRYGSRFRFVDTFINEDGGDLTPSDRVGVYAFAEKVTRDDDRLDFEALSEDGSSGGWLLSVNRMDPIPANGFPAENGALSPQFFHTAGPDRVLQTNPNQLGNELEDDIPRQYNGFFNFENPSGYRINSAQRSRIEKWFRRFEDILYDDARWLDPVNGYRRHLDTRDFIDYFHLHNLSTQGDGMLLSIFPWVSSVDYKLRIGPLWDCNLGAYAGNPTEELLYRADRLWFPRLFEDPGFMQEFIDRWYELRRGPFSSSNLRGLVSKQAREFTLEMALQQGISAPDWTTQLNDMKNYLATRSAWIDTQFFQPPAFSHPGGTVGRQFTLELSGRPGETGTIFFTTDGSDPIEGGGTAYRVALVLDTTVQIRARIRSTAGEWSALNEASYIVGTPPRTGDLVLSEIMYYPLGNPGAEFLEILNINPVQSLDLSLTRFVDGVEFTFPVGSVLTPGERVLVVRDQNAFEAVYGTSLNVVGEFEFGSALDNSGDHITLLNPDGEILLDFIFGDDPPWPESADGEGDSLVLLDPLAGPDHEAFTSWRSSSSTGGNPGTDDRRTLVGDPFLDRDGDGISALLEHLLSTSDLRPDQLGDFLTWKQGVDGETELFLNFSLAARSVEFPGIEMSSNLREWNPVPASPLFHEHLSAGRARYRWVLPAPRPSQRYFRIRVSQRTP